MQTSVLALLLGLVMSLILLIVVQESAADAKQSTIVFIAPTKFDDASSVEWIRLQEAIRSTQASKIVILWKGKGGQLYIMDKFNNAVDDARRQGKTVVFIVQGMTVSAHALAVCHGTTYTLQSGSVLIFHPAFRNMKTPDGKKWYTNDKSIFDECVRRGIISDQEVDEIVDKKLRLEVTNHSRQFKPDWE